MGSARFGLEAVLFLLTLPFWIVFAKMLGLYAHDDARADHSTADEGLGVINLVTLGTWVVFVAAWVTKLSHPQLEPADRLLGARADARPHRAGARPRDRETDGRPTCRTASFSARATSASSSRGRSSSTPSTGSRSSASSTRTRADAAPRSSICRARGLARICRDRLRNIDRPRHRRLLGRARTTRRWSLSGSLRDQDVIVDVVPRLYELVGPRADIHLLEGLPLVTVPPARLPRSSLDRQARHRHPRRRRPALLTAPVFVVAASRSGASHRGRSSSARRGSARTSGPFTLLKFRTMGVDTDQAQHREYIKRHHDAPSDRKHERTYKLERDQDVTPFGRFAAADEHRRAAAADQRAQGEMSLVGPRPCMSTRPSSSRPTTSTASWCRQGMTGPLAGRGAGPLDAQEALDLDVAYVRSWSLGSICGCCPHAAGPASGQRDGLSASTRPGPDRDRRPRLLGPEPGPQHRTTYGRSELALALRPPRGGARRRVGSRHPGVRTTDLLRGDARRRPDLTRSRS